LTESYFDEFYIYGKDGFSLYPHYEALLRDVAERNRIIDFGRYGQGSKAALWNQ